MKYRLMLLLHNVIAHPVMGVLEACSPTLCSRWGEKLHNMTLPKRS